MLFDTDSGGAKYEIQKSLRFRASAAAYLSRTPTVAGNRKTWTWSGWVKRGALGTQQFVFEAAQDANNRLAFIFGNNAADSLTVLGVSAGANLLLLETSAAYRDPSSHYHIVVAVDTTQATASNRTLLYVNGVQVTAFATATYPTQNFGTQVNAAVLHRFGVRATGLTNPLDGYLSEINFIDGQALDPSYFGQVSAETGAWIPKKYTGTYGTNGFYLPFNDGSTLGNLTADRSGNGNNWTANNISLTSGSSYDWMDDTPTNNFAVLNPLYVRGTAAVLSSANLSFQTQGSSQCETSGSHALPDSGKFYWEYVVTSMPTSRSMVGVGLPYVGTNIFTDSTNGCGYYSLDGKCYIGNVAQFTGATYTVNDVIGIAVDRDAGIVAFYKNNSLQGTASFNVSGVLPMLCDTDTTAGIHVGGYINFGQRPFTYAPPAGFKALCTKNLPAPSILNPKKHFDATTYTGNGTNAPNALTVTNSGSMRPDLVWIKRRDTSATHVLQDSVRGLSVFLSSDTTGADAITGGGDVSSLNGNGFTISYNNARDNAAGGTYVGWQWKAGGAAVTNNDGSISSQVSANPAAGFSIVTYTGNTSASQTVGHGLGVAPALFMVKCRGAASTSWMVHHKDLGNSGGSPAYLQYLQLEATAAKATSTSLFPTAGLTSTTIPLSGATNNVNVNNSTTFVAYCFAEIPGFSKIGSYIGNGSADGPFVHCGFRPRYVLIKRIDAAGNWYALDSVRLGYNPSNYTLFPNLSNAEQYSVIVDITSSGFKVRDTAADVNASGGSYIFYAVAEQPLQFANAR